MIAGVGFDFERVDSRFRGNDGVDGGGNGESVVGRAASWFPLSPLAGAGISSESGFTGLWDFQDFTGASLSRERLSIFVLAGFSVIAKIARWAK